ncbi:hypothetical protein ACEWY4_013414 [Coilia grayii]|uniref:Ras association domain-containing protein 5 n=1 Tax=Coilia grayii TaxID=363190 RepID=A0ABD1JW86_9TELE
MGLWGRRGNVPHEEEERWKALSDEELSVKIEEYNAKVSENEQGMKLASDGSYTGFIKVHLRLRRPVTVCDPPGGAEEGGPSEAGVATEEAGSGAGSSPGRTSFYLPSDAVKQLHVGSTTTVGEVIQGLLKKYTVLDNPRKFALYRQTHRDGQDLFQKLPGSEHPLYLRLVAGPDPEQLTFVLKENETGDVEWHAFSLPELQNFLAILEKEEKERVRLVEQRYGAYRHRLMQALQETQGQPG